MRIKQKKESKGKGKKKTKKPQKGLPISFMNELVSIDDVDFINVADIAVIEEEIKFGKITDVKRIFSLNDESDDSGFDELDSIIDEGSFDDL